MTDFIQNKEETISILKVLMNEIRNGILCSSATGQNFPDVQSIQTKKIDSHGILYFLLSSDSKSYQNIQINNEIKLIYTIPHKSELLLIMGVAQATNNNAFIQKYWSPENARYFKNGQSDSSIRVLKIIIKYSKWLKSDSNSMIDVLKLLGRTIGNIPS